MRSPRPSRLDAPLDVQSEKLRAALAAAGVTLCWRAARTPAARASRAAHDRGARARRSGDGLRGGALDPHRARCADAACGRWLRRRCSMRAARCAPRSSTSHGSRAATRLARGCCCTASSMAAARFASRATRPTGTSAPGRRGPRERRPLPGERGCLARPRSPRSCVRTRIAATISLEALPAAPRPRRACRPSAGALGAMHFPRRRPTRARTPPTRLRGAAARPARAARAGARSAGRAWARRAAAAERSRATLARAGPAVLAHRRPARRGAHDRRRSRRATARCSACSWARSGAARRWSRCTRCSAPSSTAIRRR